MATGKVVAGSFVTEVLATCGKLEKDDLATKLHKLSKQVQEVQAEVTDALQKKYANFDVSLNTAVELSSRSKDMLEDMNATASKIDNEIQSQLVTSTKEFKELSTQLEESNCILAILEKLLHIHDGLVDVRSAQDEAKFEKSANLLNQVQEQLDNTLNKSEEGVQILRVLKREFAREREKFVQDMAQIWAEEIQWVIPEHAEETAAEIQQPCELRLPNHEEKLEKLCRVLGAMNIMSVLDTYLGLFASRLMKHMLRPLISEPSVSVVVEQLPGMTTMKINKHSAEDKDRSPKHVFHKLRPLLELLQESIFQNEVLAKEGTSKTLMHYLGRHLSYEFVNLVIQKCLADSIPSSNSELQKYRTVISDTKEFQDYLIEIEFLGENDSRLTDYVANVNELFAAKKTKEILVEARTLMTGEIHNMVKVTNATPLGELKLPEGGGKKLKFAESMALKSYSKLSGKTFQLPNCYISEWTQQLICMAYETMHEATRSDQPTGLQLFYAVRGIFEMYCNVVPTYHKDSLETLPQLSAIHHNNCMFIAHHLLTMGHQFKSQLPSLVQQVGPTFVDLVPKIRRIGTSALLEQLKAQRDQLLDFLQGAQGFVNVSEEVEMELAEKAIRQCLHQLQHLSRIWKEVLPNDIYCKSIGTLLNAVVVEIINSIVSLEDISEDNTNTLHSLLTTIKDRAPSLFTLDGDTPQLATLHTSVPKWTKFNELIVTLNARLAEIADRWADGKGPLAEAFTPNEVKLLVRALFQNTEQRAAVLAKIR